MVFAAPAGSDLGLADALKALHETTYRDDRLPLRVGAHLSSVDYRSKLLVEFDEAKLKEVASNGAAGARLPPEGPSDDEITRAAAALLEQVKALLEAQDELTRKVLAFREQSVEGAIDAATVQSLEAEVAALAAKREPLLETAEKAMENRVRALGWSLQQDDRGFFVDPRVQRMMGELEDGLLPDGKLFDPDALVALLSDQYELLYSLVRDDLAAAERAGVVGLRVRAHLSPDRRGSEQQRLHVENYDNLSVGGGNVKRAVSFNLSPEEQLELKERLRVVSDYARFFNDLRNEDSDLRADIRGLREAFEGDLDALERSIGAVGDKLEGLLKTESPLAEFDRLLTKLREEEIAPDAVTKLEAAREKLARVLQTKQDFESFAATVRLGRLESEDALFGLLDGASDLFTSFGGVMSDLPALVSELVAAVEAARDSLEATIAGLPEDSELRGELQEWIRKHFSGTEAQWSQLAGGIGESYPAVWGHFTTLHANLLGALSRSDAASKLPVSPLDEDGIIRPLDDPLPAQIFLSQTPADRGDRLILIVELVQQAEGQELAIVASYMQEFDVVRRGLYNTVDAPLIFVDRVDEPSGALTDTSFEASPSASWTLHYKKLEQGRLRADGTIEDPDGWARSWNFLDPGLGVNVAALNFEDDDVEVGVGFQLTFFSDLLMVGYGWNLGVDDERDYMFLGVGIIELLDIAGLGVPETGDD